MKSAILAFLLGFLFASLMPKHSFPHGAAWWIAEGAQRGIGGSLCCGERDCGYLSENAVHATRAGYEVHGWVTVEPPNGEPFAYRVDEIVPYGEAQPSPNELYWRCAWGGSDPNTMTQAEYMAKADRKCFFSPPPSM